MSHKTFYHPTKRTKIFIFLSNHQNEPPFSSKTTAELLYYLFNIIQTHQLASTAYLLISRRECNKDANIEKLESKRRGRPLLLGDELDKCSIVCESFKGSRCCY